MPIEKKPTNPLGKDFRPPQSNPYRVKNGDSWGIVARRHGMTAWDLIRFNFNTSDAAEVNWYLHHNVGCTEQTRNGRNYIFSASANPGVIYVPMKVIHSPPITIEGQRPKEPETIAFWFNAVQGSVSLWKFLSYRKLAGDLCMRINKSPSDWYAWRLSASLGKVSVPIKGSPPISLSKFATTEHSFKFNRKLFDPRTDWREKNVIVKIAGSKLWITIQRALPRAPGPGYAPIHGHTSQDLTLELLMDGPELEGCIGVGFINNGCPVKPMRPPNPYGLTNDGLPDDGWT